MTMTPEQLREWADMAESASTGQVDRVDIYRGYAAALEELARLRARLEIDFAIDGNGKRVPFPAGGPDGIACRDETIRLLEAALAESERKCERLKFHADAMYGALIAFGIDGGNLEEYRAEFKEES